MSIIKRNYMEAYNKKINLNSKIDPQLITILKSGNDLIIKYKINNEIKKIILLISYLKQLYKEKTLLNLRDIVKRYLSIDANIEILDVIKYEKIEYKKKDFEIQIINISTINKVFEAEFKDTL